MHPRGRRREERCRFIPVTNRGGKMAHHCPLVLHRLSVSTIDVVRHHDCRTMRTCREDLESFRARKLLAQFPAFGYHHCLYVLKSLIRTHPNLASIPSVIDIMNGVA